MKLKQISVQIENSHDRVYEFTRALGDAGINLRALTLVDTGNFGELRVLVSDTSAARQILMKKDIPARVDDVVAVQMEDKPGQLADLLERLMAAGIKIKYGYALAGMDSGKQSPLDRVGGGGCLRSLADRTSGTAFVDGGFSAFGSRDGVE